MFIFTSINGLRSVATMMAIAHRDDLFYKMNAVIHWRFRQTINDTAPFNARKHGKRKNI